MQISIFKSCLISDYFLYLKVASSLFTGRKLFGVCFAVRQKINWLRPGGTMTRNFSKSRSQPYARFELIIEVNNQDSLA